MRQLRQADLGDRRHHHAPLQAAAEPWFWAAYLMATHSNGISALQLQRQLALGSYRRLATLRKAAGQHGGPWPRPLAGLVEVDETEIVCRSRTSP